MKNPDQEPQENEEIQNIEQFQIDRSSAKSAEGHADENEDDTFSLAEEPDELDEDDELESDDESYTEDEIPFADGEGTQLDEAIDEQEESEDDDNI